MRQHPRTIALAAALLAGSAFAAETLAVGGMFQMRRVPLLRRGDAAEAAPARAPDAAGVTFEGNVRPLLTSRCAPCHNPGGKMYAKLPFDDAEVVRSHKEGVLRRLKGDDKRLVETWLASH